MIKNNHITKTIKKIYFASFVFFAVKKNFLREVE